MATDTTTPCLSFTLPIPQLPAPLDLIFAASFGLDLSFPSLGFVGIPCCKFTLPAFNIQLPFAVAIPPNLLGPIVYAINMFVELYLGLLPTIIIPNCNF